MTLTKMQLKNLWSACAENSSPQICNVLMCLCVCTGYVHQFTQSRTSHTMQKLILHTSTHFPTDNRPVSSKWQTKILNSEMKRFRWTTTEVKYTSITITHTQTRFSQNSKHTTQHTFHTLTASKMCFIILELWNAWICSRLMVQFDWWIHKIETYYLNNTLHTYTHTHAHTHKPT